MRIFQSNVISVLLYGCETWKMNEGDEKCLDTFVHTCLRRILKIFWPTRISNDEVRSVAGIERVSTQIRKRRWRYIGHVLRKKPDDDQRIALKWTPDGKRKRGRPRETWRRTVERERGKLGFKSWEAAGAAARDRQLWRSFIRCPTLHSRSSRN